MRLLGHNGEINTLLGNLNWARATEVNLDAVWGEAAEDLKPVVNPSFSDSANLDATLELLVRSGRPITDSLLTLVPEAFRDQPELKNQPEIKAFYEFSACTQEPWDGPALLVFSDGCFVGATLDRNGLRPARYTILLIALCIFSITKEMFFLFSFFFSFCSFFSSSRCCSNRCSC